MAPHSHFCVGISRYVLLVCLIAVFTVGNLVGQPVHYAFKGYAFHWCHGWPLFYLMRANYPVKSDPTWRYSSQFPFDGAEVLAFDGRVLVFDAAIAVLLIVAVLVTAKLRTRLRLAGNLLALWAIDGLFVAIGLGYWILSAGGVETRFCTQPGYFIPVFLTLLITWLTCVILATLARPSGAGGRKRPQFTLRTLMIISYFAVPGLLVLMKYGVTFAKGQTLIFAFPPFFGLIALVFVVGWIVAVAFQDIWGWVSSSRVSPNKRRIAYVVMLTAVSLAWLSSALVVAICIPVWWESYVGWNLLHGLLPFAWVIFGSEGRVRRERREQRLSSRWNLSFLLAAAVVGLAGLPMLYLLLVGEMDLRDLFHDGPCFFAAGLLFLLYDLPERVASDAPPSREA